MQLQATHRAATEKEEKNVIMSCSEHTRHLSGVFLPLVLFAQDEHLLSLEATVKKRKALLPPIDFWTFGTAINLFA